jgi:hypothetical protein
MSDTTHNRKYFWFVMAYVTAAGSYAVAAKSKHLADNYMLPPDRFPRKELGDRVRRNRASGLP